MLIIIEEEQSPLPTESAIMRLFNPIIPFEQFKRKPGRPLKEPPPPPKGIYYHVMLDNDDEDDDGFNDTFTAFEQRKFKADYHYEVDIEGRIPHAVLVELAELYNIDYKTAYACIRGD